MHFHFLILLLLLFGCERSSKEKSKIAATLHSYTPLAARYKEAASDDQLFHIFKQDPLLNLLEENASYREGVAALQCITEKFPYLCNKLEELRSNDTFGSPRTYQYEKIGRFSPTTLHYIVITGKIHEQLGDLKGKHLVQIGGGYGGLCCVLHAVHTFASYTLIDIPEALMLTKRYLAENGIQGVRLIPLGDLQEEIVADVVISDRSFFEWNKELQSCLITKVLAHASHGFLLGKQLPKHYRIVPYSPKEMQKKLAAKGIKATLEEEKSFPSLSTFTLAW